MKKVAMPEGYLKYRPSPLLKYEKYEVYIFIFPPEGFVEVLNSFDVVGVWITQ